MKTWGSAAAVIAAIRDDAAAECERIEREAAATIASVRSGLLVPVTVDTGDRVAAARQAAADRESDADWEETQSAIADREAWIQRVVSLGRQALSEEPADAAAAWVAALIRDAAPQLPGEACTVAVPARLAAVCDDAWRAGLEKAVGKQLTIRFDGPAAGCVLQTPDGSVTFDNAIAALERRTARRWRPALARVYEATVSQAAPATAREPVGAGTGQVK